MPLAAAIPAVIGAVGGASSAATLGAAAIGAGATLYAGSQAKKASNKALDAQTQANNQQLQLQREQMERAERLNEPFRQGGLSAFDQLLREYNLAPQPTAQPQAAGGVGAPQAPAPTAPAAPGPDGAAYLQANPDVQAEFQRNMASGKGREYLASIGADTPEGFAQWHYQTFGQSEGRAMPQTQPAAAEAPTSGPYVPTTPEAPAAPRPGTELLTAPRPDAPQRPEFTRPTAGSAPELSSFLSNFQEDPGYRFRLQEGADSVNAFSAARGKLRSGDAAKAIMARSSDLASQEYGNWFDRQLRAYAAAQDAYRYDTTRTDNNFSNDRAYETGLWDYDTRRSDQNFNADRTFQQQQENTRLSNLFSLANMGQTAASAVTGAGSTYAANAGTIFGSQANAAADAAYNRANANAGMVGSLAGTAANLFANWGGGAPSAPQSNLGSVNYGSSLSNPFGRSYSF